MKTFIRKPTLQLWIAILMAAALTGPPGLAAAQFIDTGTPTATQEPGSGGDWGNLLPGRGSDDSSDSAPQLEGDVYVLPSSGVEVVIGPGVTTDSSADTEVPDQIIIETDDGIGAIAVLDSLGTPLDILERYVEGFGESMDSVVEVDVQSSRNLATGIYRVETEGLSIYMFISVDGGAVDGYNVIEVVIADAADIGSSLVQMRENVTINGVPAFAHVVDEDVIDIIWREEG